MSRRKMNGSRRRTTVTIPANGTIHVQMIFAEMKRQNFTYDDVEEGAGVRRQTLKAWRKGQHPALDSLEAVFGFLGYDFVPIQRSAALSPQILEALTPLALDLIDALPTLVDDLYDIVASQHERHPGPPRGTA